jgi:hypothetical protein
MPLLLNFGSHALAEGELHFLNIFFVVNILGHVTALLLLDFITGSYEILLRVLWIKTPSAVMSITSGAQVVFLLGTGLSSQFLGAELPEKTD